jgi:hypothetical protein
MKELPLLVWRQILILQLRRAPAMSGTHMKKAAHCTRTLDC